MNYYDRSACGQGRSGVDRNPGMTRSCGKQAPVCRSVFMRTEEIDRERERSGWNPYEGEEEFWEEEVDETMQESDGRMNSGMPGMDQRMPGTNQEMSGEMQDGTLDRNMGMEGMPEVMQPYFRIPDYEQTLEEQRMAERDLRMLQSMYPEAGRILLPYIEEECDKMEYEGSPMYDEHPDRTTIYRIQNRIYNAVEDQFPPQPEPVQDDMLTMQVQGTRRNPPGRNWLEDLIQIMLLQEMHHRRCRHGRCRRRYR